MEAQHKLHTTAIRIGLKQRKTWDKEARQYGYNSLSEFIRSTMDQHVILGGPSKADINMILDKLASLTSELNHIGNNINQIAKHANAYDNISDNLNLCLEELEEAVSSVYKINAQFNQTRFRKTGTSRKWKPKEKINDSQN